MGDAIDGARKHYNEFVGSVQGRLLPALRKFEEKDARSARELPAIRAVEGETRALDTGGLLDASESEIPRPSPLASS